MQVEATFKKNKYVCCFFYKNVLVKTKKKSGENLRKSGKSQGKIREFHGLKKWEPCVARPFIDNCFCRKGNSYKDVALEQNTQAWLAVKGPMIGKRPGRKNARTFDKEKK